MPRSDSGRTAARGWSAGGARKHHPGAEFQNSGHETRVWSFLDQRSHHAGAGRASTGPSSAEEGSKMCNLRALSAGETPALPGRSCMKRFRRFRMTTLPGLW